MNVADYFDDLDAHEDCVPWMYCDSRGFVTVGIGNLVSSPSAAASLPFRHKDGNAALPGERETAWAQVNDAFKPNQSAAAYQDCSDLRLSRDFMRGLVASRLVGEFVPGITRICPAFDSMPLPARRALVDMAYNLGVHGLGMFPHMLAAVNAGDWEMAAGQCHRSTCRDTRNAWTAQMFIDAGVAR
jgi:GH24 family phage-related lysozyme (muramidase)